MVCASSAITISGPGRIKYLKREWEYRCRKRREMRRCGRRRKCRSTEKEKGTMGEEEKG